MLHTCISWTQKKSNFLSPAKRFPSKLILIRFSSVQFSSVAQSCPNLCEYYLAKKKKNRNQGHCLPLYQLMHHNYFLIKTVSKNVFWWLLLWLSLLLSYQKQILFPDKITHFSTFCHSMEGN